MPNLVELGLECINSRDMPSLIREITDLCFQLRILTLSISDEYTRNVGTKDMAKHNYFKDVKPMLYLGELKLAIDIFTGAKEIVDAFPNLYEISISNYGEYNHLGMGR